MTVVGFWKKKIRNLPRVLFCVWEIQLGIYPEMHAEISINGVFGRIGPLNFESLRDYFGLDC